MCEGRPTFCRTKSACSSGATRASRNTASQQIACGPVRVIRTCGAYGGLYIFRVPMRTCYNHRRFFFVTLHNSLFLFNLLLYLNIDKRCRPKLISSITMMRKLQTSKQTRPLLREARRRTLGPKSLSTALDSVTFSSSQN